MKVLLNIILTLYFGHVDTIKYPLYAGKVLEARADDRLVNLAGCEILPTVSYEVRSCSDGFVFAALQEDSCFGVVIKTNKGFIYGYSQMDSIFVHKGEQIKLGQLLGAIKPQGSIYGRLYFNVSSKEQLIYRNVERFLVKE